MSTAELETTATTGLTALDLKAIRMAERICFYHHGNSRTGRGEIMLRKDVEQTRRNPFTSKTEDYTIDNLQSTVTDYQDDTPTDSDYSCFGSTTEYEHSYSSVWRTIAKFIATGDDLQLRWVADNSQLTRECGLHVDSLYLVVKRYKGDKFTTYPFLIETLVSRNNTARMVRPR